MRRPPSRELSGLASLGRTISFISDCESRTGRGGKSADEVIVSWSVNLRRDFALQIGFDVALCHFLNVRLGMSGKPLLLGHIVLQFAVRSREMSQLADEPQFEH